jgi:hypothetical protein
MGSSARMPCPVCESPFVRPSRRRKPLDGLLALVGFHPVRCQTCGGRFYRLGTESSSGEASDRREFERVAVALPVTFERQETSGSGTTVNLSPDGCGILSSTVSPVGTVVRVRVSSGLHSVDLPGAVVHCIAGKGFGVQFSALSAKQRTDLGVLLSECRRTVGKRASGFDPRRLGAIGSYTGWVGALRWVGMILVITALGAAVTVGVIRCTEFACDRDLK